MVCSCYIKGLRWLPVGVVAFFVLAQPLQSLGGEKIQISGRTSKGSQSDESLKSGLYSDPLDFMKSRGSGGGGVVGAEFASAGYVLANPSKAGGGQQLDV